MNNIIDKIKNKFNKKINKLKFIYLLRKKTVLSGSQKSILVKEHKKFAYIPLISLIMPVYNVKKAYLTDAIDSVLNQIYFNWELCIVDDASEEKHIKPLLKKYAKKDSRIKVFFSKKNRHIAGSSNLALKMAQGDYIGFLDNDDRLMPHALFECVKLLNRDRKLDFIYSDNSIINKKGQTVNIALKPQWSPELFLSTNYIIHFCLYSSKILHEIGEFSCEECYKGVQDIDLKAKLMDKTSNIAFIPKVLYEWRNLKSSVNSGSNSKPYVFENAVKVYQDVLDRNRKQGKAVIPRLAKRLNSGFYKINFNNLEEESVAVLLAGYNPNINDIIKDNTIWQNYSILQISQPMDNKRLISGINSIDSDYLIFLSPKTVNLNPYWIHELVGYMRLDGKIGAVGGKTLSIYNKIIKGSYIFMKEIQILNRGEDNNYNGYWFNNILPGNSLAVSDYCMITTKKLFLDSGGFDYENFGEFACVDYCLKLKEMGFRIVFNPWCEGVVNDEDDNPANKDHYKNILLKYKDLLGNDPYYNPNFSQIKQFQLNKQKKQYV